MEFDIAFVLPFITDWLLTTGVRVALILVGALLAVYVLRILIARVIRRVFRKGQNEGREKRENTLIQVADGTIRVLVWAVALLMILSELGVAIGPLLAAAGIVGIAVGFGGQYLIRDLVSGFFIIIENQYRVGDVVCFDNKCGLVEAISLRMTTLRDLDGTVLHIPHGEVKTVSNLSKQFSRVNLDIGVAYDSDIEHVITVVNRVGQELAEDPDWKDKIIEAPKFLRINEFADSAIIIKILGDTKPIEQWDVAGELRKRLKIAFDKEGIEIPFPQRVVHQTK